MSEGVLVSVAVPFIIPFFISSANADSHVEFLNISATVEPLTSLRLNLPTLPSSLAFFSLSKSSSNPRLPGQLLPYRFSVMFSIIKIGMLMIAVSKATIIVKTGSFGAGVKEQFRSVLLHVHCEAPS